MKTKFMLTSSYDDEEEILNVEIRGKKIGFKLECYHDEDDDMQHIRVLAYKNDEIVNRMLISDDSKYFPEEEE
jgi:hypothetical protein